MEGGAATIAVSGFVHDTAVAPALRRLISATHAGRREGVDKAATSTTPGSCRRAEHGRRAILATIEQLVKARNAARCALTLAHKPRCAVMTAMLRV